MKYLLLFCRLQVDFPFILFLIRLKFSLQLNTEDRTFFKLWTDKVFHSSWQNQECDKSVQVG